MTAELKQNLKQYHYQNSKMNKDKRIVKNEALKLPDIVKHELP